MQGEKFMKKVRWNKHKFKENVLVPAGLVLLFVAMSVRWF